MDKQKGLKYDIFNNLLILKSIWSAITEYVYAIIGWHYLIYSKIKWQARVNVEKGSQRISASWPWTISIGTYFQFHDDTEIQFTYSQTLHKKNG